MPDRERTFAVHEARCRLVHAAELIALDVQRMPERFGLRPSARSESANAPRRRRRRRRSPGACRARCRTVTVSAVAVATTHETIPVWSTVVRGRAQTRDGVAVAADVVRGDVLDVVDRDLGGEVRMNFDELAVRSEPSERTHVRQILRLDGSKERLKPLERLAAAVSRRR